uniref:Circadian locomoter output cycles protein kaput n=1 Tax=Ceratitis capitata TaxID=7213 RepID=W8C156_CERCA
MDLCNHFNSMGLTTIDQILLLFKVLIATARIIRPPKFVNSICNSLEYRTRHLIDGRILECDQKIGLVAGYMAGEVRGTSPFTFIHDDDMPYVIVALRQMYDDGRTTGESTYRLSTNTGQYIYLRSKGFLDVDETNNVVHSFLCVNTLLDEEEGKRKLAQMRRDYGPRVSKEFPHLALKSPDAHDPQELENAVFRLVENLQKPSAEYDEDDGDSSTESYSSEYVPPSEEEIRRCSAHFFKNSYSTVHAAGYRFGKSSKTPPLALVPPEACSIRTSINRSINVVNTTAVKNLSNEQINTSNAVNCQPATNQHASPVEIDGLTTSSESCLCQGKSTDYCNYCLKLNSQSSHSLSNKRSGESMDSQELKLPKRRLKSAEIEHVLSDSLDQLGRTLDKQLSAAKELRDKSTKYEVPNSNQRLDELMEEHQMQSQIYVDIKSEYEVQKQNNSIDTNTTMHTMHGNQRQQQQFSADENDN